MKNLNRQFIRYTLLVLGWKLFCLQNCLNPKLDWMCQAVVADVNSTSMAWGFHSTRSPKVGLRFGDCWVQWTHCHFYETCLTWFELFDIAFSADWRWVHCSHKEEHSFTLLLSSNFGRMCELQHQNDWFWLFFGPFYSNLRHGSAGSSQ